MSAYHFDPHAHRGVGNVSEVPRYQVVDTIGNGDGDMDRVVRSLSWNRTSIDQRIRETLCI